ncbi:MAG TPA: molybdopterin-dependent oxidoreductase [Actinomycetota bacterium]|jgi:DMSO/TMAO reductase YedYZ molybdopterin-dependent catalytic subunit|nr:molybdopterin-dependent oxidoreductase [Actinomycetota bacterium]
MRWPARPRIGPFSEGAFRSRLHDERLASILGIALGVAFAACFVTGLISHLIQNPVSWFSWPSRPVWLYRVTQGVHVVAGIAAIPLLLAKLWVVSPRFWTWPPFRDLGHAIERAGVLPLVAGSLFLLFTGIGTINRFKPWGFSFPAAHYSAAWITIGALVIHVGAKLHVAARSLARGSAPTAPTTRHDVDGSGWSISRRGFLWGTVAAGVAVTIATIGQTLRPLRSISVLAPRDPAVGPQGLPVNRTASSAGVIDAATSPAYRLVVEGAVATPLSMSIEDLRSLPQHDAELPITCVDGWSASGTWRGVAVPDLLELAGAQPDATAEIVSLQRPGSAYATSQLDRSHAADPDTLLALELNGEVLHIDHGFPVRLVAPNRPGVMQTKWVAKVVVT